jgi:flagellar basal body-associated protein FliL
VLISIFIAFFALVVGFFVAWLVLRNRKPAANAPTEAEPVETE